MTVAATPVWGDPSAWDNPPALADEVEADVCVVGLGGSGLAAIGAALDAGARVVGIDAGPVAGGAAGRNGGFLLAGAARFYHDAVAAWGRERAAGIYAETLVELERLFAEVGPLARRSGRCGSLRRPRRRTRSPRSCDALQRDGFPAERRDGGVFIPTDGSIQPLERCRLLAGRALERGARLFGGLPRHGDRRRPGADAGRGGGLSRRGRLRRRLDGARAAGARGPRALLAAADAGHRAGRAGDGPVPGLRQLGLRVLAADGRGPDRARRRAPGARGRRVGAGGHRRRAGAGPARRAAARARRDRRAGDPSLGRRDRLHGRPAAGVRGAAAGGPRGRRVLRPRQRPGLRGGPRRDGDRTRRCAPAARRGCCARSTGRRRH